MGPSREPNMDKIMNHKYPRMKLGRKVKVEVWENTYGQIYDEVKNTIRFQIWNRTVVDQLFGIVGDQIWTQVGNLVLNKINLRTNHT